MTDERSDAGTECGPTASRRRCVRGLSALAATALAGCNFESGSETDPGGDGVPSDTAGGENSGHGGVGTPGTDDAGQTASTGRPAGRATVSLGGETADTAVSPELFGRFAEHYAREIYPGIYAEHLSNNSFETGAEWDWGRTSVLYGAVESRAGLAYPWEPYPTASGGSGGDGGVTFELVGGVHGGEDADCQRVVLHGSEGGVRQRTALPDFRTLSYDLSVSVRGTVDAVEARLVTADGEATAATAELPVGDEWERREVTLELPSASDSDYVAGAVADIETPFGEYELRFVAEGEGHVDLDWAMLRSGDAVRGKYNPTTVALMRDRNVRLLKWPGGNFTSQYDWRDGVGPLAERPVRTNDAWAGLEPNFFGTAEYVEFCEIVDIDPIITVGASDRVGPETAAAWVEYCNGSTDTEMGALRAEHGHEEPFDVRTWEVGNEVYGPWQIGHTDDPATFAERAAEYAEAMRAVDDSIEILADGMDPLYDDPNLPDPQAWNDAVFERAGDLIRGLDVHRYDWGIRDAGARESWVSEPGREPLDYSEVLVMFPTQYGQLMAELADRASEAGVDPFEVFVGEWGLYPSVSGGWPHPGMGTMAGACYVAGMYNAFVRQGETVTRAAHTHLPVRMFPPEHADFPPNPNPLLPTGKVLDLYAAVFDGDATWKRVPVSVDGGTRTIPETGHRIRRMEGVPYVDAAAVRSEAGDVCVFATNRNLRGSTTATVDLDGFDGAAATVTLLRPTGDPHEGQSAFGEGMDDWANWRPLDAYEVVEREATVEDGELTVELPSASVARTWIGG